MKSVIGITMGDPAGIGPEIIIKALTHPKVRDDYELVVFGDGSFLRKTADKLGISAKFNLVSDFRELNFKPNAVTVYDVFKLNQTGFKIGRPQAYAGDLAYQIIVEAVSKAMDKKIAAIVTAPICKESLHLAKHFFDGHTGLIAQLTNTADYRMMFSAQKLKILHVTAHLPLVEACRALTEELVFKTILLGHSHMKQLGIANPKIAVCGLNPHAGENGIFGREDIDIISPAVEQAKSKGMTAFGPLPADTTFLKAYQGEFDLVVAQYHDQGHAPGKLVAFDTAVNVTVGLPIIRTSVDHGTAFDIANKGIANYENLNCAIDYAVRLAK